MGVKSTVTLDRSTATERLTDLYIEEVSALVRTGIAKMTNRVIGDELERLNDQRCGGEGFENYTVTGGDA